MQVLNGATLFSASDLVNFLECEHTTTLGLVDLVTPLPRAESDESNRLVQDKGFAHEESFLESLRAKGRRIAEIPQHLPAEEAARATLEALAAGPDIIFQTAFLSPPFYGRADFLRRVEGRSGLGDWQYEVMDTKLARSVKAKFVIQLCFYSDLLAQAQAGEPRSMHLVLGDGTEKNFRCANYSRYFRQLRARFAEYSGAAERATYPERGDHCQFCDWRNLCQQKWIDDDYLNQVTGIRRDQTSLLEQSYEDKEGRRHGMTLEDVLVVAPYNAQANFLRSRLPAGARVGTIDKFQGLEAQVVVVSMTTSSGEYLPRNIEFLHDKNRLNVAVSRARCLSVVIASPRLSPRLFHYQPSYDLLHPPLEQRYLGRARSHHPRSTGH